MDTPHPSLSAQSQAAAESFKTLQGLLNPTIPEIDQDPIKTFAKLSLRVSNLRREVHYAVQKYAQATCLELSTRLLALPQELRDLIYIELFRDMSHFFEMIWPRNDSVWQGHCPGPPCSCLKSLPHFIDLNFMGHQVAREILLFFKTVATDYEMYYTIHSKDLKTFCEADIFHVGITREEVFRGLDLNVQMGQYFYDDDKAWKAVRDIVLRDINVTTMLLLSIPFEGARTITFQIEHNLDYAANLSEILSALRPAFHGLKEKGFGVWLRYKNWSLDVDWELDDAAWNWSLDEWKTMMRKLGDLNVEITGDLTNAVNLPPYLFEEEFLQQEPTWKAIAQDLYGVDFEAENR